MSNVVVRSSWKDCPHLSEKQKNEQRAIMRPHQRRAREDGIPQVGAGAVYPIAEEDITCDPFVIPDQWPKGYALDVGWNRTAALWGAHDKASDIIYLWSEHYLAESPPAIHGQAIRARGSWMHGVIDPASRGRSQDDGEQLFRQYTLPMDVMGNAQKGGQGLSLSVANNAVETGLDEVWQRMLSGRLKVFRTLMNFFYEFRLYKRDEKGKIVKVDDHLMDCARYLCLSGVHIMTPTPPAFSRFGPNKKAVTKDASDWSMFDQLAKEQAMQ